jgi:hypothetical protein
LLGDELSNRNLGERGVTIEARPILEGELLRLNEQVHVFHAAEAHPLDVGYFACGLFGPGQPAAMTSLTGNPSRA